MQTTQNPIRPILLSLSILLATSGCSDTAKPTSVDAALPSDAGNSDTTATPDFDHQADAIDSMLTDDDLDTTDSTIAIDTVVPIDGAEAGLPVPNLKRAYVKDATARHAVCNDGSPAVYYGRKGINGNHNRWVIFLRGGEACTSAAGCAERQTLKPQLMSSTSYAATLTPGGILSPDPAINPDFYDWSHIFIMYCSSDSWSGDKAPTTEAPWDFRGHRILNAIVEDLKVFATNPLANAAEIILSGSSAGAGGVRQNLDHFASLFPTISVKGLADASLGSVIFPNASSQEAADKRQAKTEFWNAQVDSSCLAAQGNTGDCTNSSPLLHGYISTPYFVFLDQHDSYVTKGSTDQTLLDQLAQQVRSDLAPLSGAFSTRKGFHTALNNDTRFAKTKIQGSSYADVFGNWYFNRTGPKNLVAAP
jgi:O-palmitoleoyl-L-serine hydrolase